MPLFEIGYRRYVGARIPNAMHWWPITRTGLAIAWRSKLLRRLVYVSFIPFLYFGFVFFVIGRVTDPNTEPGSPLHEIAHGLFGASLVRQLQEDPALVRSAIWSIVFGSYGTSIQLFMAGLVAAVAGPPLVASDLRTRAFLIYFARPISRLDYVLGKGAVLVALLALVTLLPSLVVYVLSILFSPSLGTLAQTLPVAGSMVLAALGTIIPAALVMLTLSSLTRQPRFATIAWFVLCLFGPIAHLLLSSTRGLRDNGWTFALSLPHTLRAWQLGLYDVEGRAAQLALRGNVVEELSSTDSGPRAALWLCVLSACCLYLLLRRVDSPTRI